MKFTINTFLGTACLAIGFLGSQTTALAIPITGDIYFGGSAVLGDATHMTPAGGASLASATQVTTFYALGPVSPLTANKATVTDASGDFADPTYGITPFVTLADFAHPYVFNPSTATDPLWSVGGFTFDLLSSTVVMQNATFLNITGTGTITGNGFTPTAGNWSFTITGTGQTPTSGRFSFNADSAALPDGGTTVALLGLSLVAIEAGRRALNARSLKA